MATLFEPLQAGHLHLKNRIIVSPMCQYSSVDGFATDWHLVHLGSRAVGGAALIICEATAVSPEGRITPDDLGIWKDEHISFLQRITTFIKEQGCVAGIQLAHAGRKASHHSPWKGGKALAVNEDAWTTVAPSAVPFKDEEPIPLALNKEGITKVIDDFKKATERCLQAGFDMIELHAAHGYLIHQFLSPLSNQRNDAYGGPFENRIRLLLELVAGVKQVAGTAFPLWVRISATDWTEGGWSIEDSVALCKQLNGAGVDLIDCSSGGNIASAKIPVGPLYQTPFAAQIRNEAGIMTGAVGLINTSEEAESILKENKADVVLLAREFLRDAYFPLRAAYELKDNIAWPVQYERAKK